MVVNAMLLICLYVYSNSLFYAIVYILVLRCKMHIIYILCLLCEFDTVSDNVVPFLWASHTFSTSLME